MFSMICNSLSMIPLRKSEFLEMSYGLELHAHSISQILSAVLNQRPLINALPEIVEYLLLALVGLAGMVIAAFIRSPFRVFLWGVTGIVLIVLTSFLALIYGWWLPVFPALVLFSLNLLGLTTFYQQQELLKEVATRNKLEGELEAAKIIQMSMLTQNGEARQKQVNYDLWATLKSAKTVSGDLYFFEEQKANKLCFGVGDVADKGTPAALFMSKTMTLLNQVIGKESNPDRILQFINDELEKNNENCMFVSLFCGVLNLETGELHFASAGHKNPLDISNNYFENQL